METLNKLMTHAVEQYGRDRTYSVRFGGSTPIITVSDDADPIAELWGVNGKIKVKRFHPLRRVYDAKREADEKADAIRRARQLIEDSFRV
jgi:hypothetical protein